MKIVQQNTYKIEYIDYGLKEVTLVEADSFEEALNIFNEYNSNNNNKLRMISISKGTSVLKPLIKTITVEI
jgi:hypothetical protein